MNSPFMQNFYCHIKDNIYWIVISRNACTSLKNISLREHLGYYPEDIDRTHAIIGNSENLFLKSLEHLPTDSLKFAVYRDPVDRLISVYKHFCIDNAKRWYFDALDLRGVSFDRFMEFVRFELSKINPLMQDEHIRRQSDYYLPSHIDVLVQLCDLDKYLSYLGIPPLLIRSNNSNAVAPPMVSDNLVLEIKELYWRDYQILHDCQSKLFVP